MRKPLPGEDQEKATEKVISIKNIGKGLKEAKPKKYSASPECQEILKSDLPATQKISDLVNTFLRNNPDFEPVEKELQHPGYFMIHRRILPWLYAQCDEEFDYVQLWRLLLAAAKEWFPGKHDTKLGHIFCVRFELEDCTWWNGWEPIQPVLQDYLTWCYGSKESGDQESISTTEFPNNGRQETTMLTENDAALAFAKAWNYSGPQFPDRSLSCTPS